MTPQERKVMELALEALEHSHANEPIWKTPHREAITAIKAALPAHKALMSVPDEAQEKALQALHDENERLGLYKDAYAQQEQEPVGYFNANSDGKWEQSDSNDGVPFYAALPPQPKEPAVAEQHKQEPLEYWNAVEGWVKIDEVREHFDSVGCATIYKTAGEGRVPLSLCKAQPEQEHTNDWSEWRGMVVQNLMRHGIDKDFARRLAHFYQDKAPQPKEPEQEPVANSEECAADVYEHGTSVGLFDMPKEEAEQYCKAETKRTGYKHDWHYFGGRVHVKALIPSPQRKPLTDEQIRSMEFDYIRRRDFARAIEAAHGITKE